jgi:O-methyltransferase involved in polyketide biosynthesis
MAIEKVQLTKEKQTLLGTLYGRALESRTAEPVLRDPWAQQAVAQIDYDFARLRMKAEHGLSVAFRARAFDRVTREFLDAHPRATVLHLGCGLDSRVFRLDPASTVRWYDVDFPDVIDLRRRLYPERSAESGYQLVASSVTESGWLEEIPSDRPTLVVAEGVLMYLTADTARSLIVRLTEHMPEGLLAFDAMNTTGLRLQRFNPVLKATGARLSWGLDDPRQLLEWAPRLELLEQVSATDFLDEGDLARFSFGQRLGLRLIGAIPAARNLGRMLRYRVRPRT